jgi:CelD/BcsL family acetyltransferase involved in cellulose biosynthesis
MQASPAGSVITFALRLDGRVLAALMARRDARRIEMLNTVFDPAYAHCRPGHVLMAQALQWAHARELSFDLRLGDYPYTRRWSNPRCDVVTYVCVNSRLGRAHVAYRATRERLERARRQVRQRLRRTLMHALGRGTSPRRAEPNA